MKIIKLIFLLLIAGLIIWVDLPNNPYFKTHLGLDLKGGSHLVFEAETSGVAPSDLADALESSRNIIERRVNLFGVSEPTVSTSKTGQKHRITVDLPGITAVSEAVALIGRTAQLTFAEEVVKEGTTTATLQPTS